MCRSLQSNPGTENNISCHILFVGITRHPDRVTCKPDRCAAPRYRAVFFMWFVQCDGRDCLQDANSFQFFGRLAGDLAGFGLVCYLEVAYADSGLPASPSRSYEISISYSEDDLGIIPEGTLALYYWDRDQWVKEPSRRFILNLISPQQRQTTSRIGQRWVKSNVFIFP